MVMSQYCDVYNFARISVYLPFDIFYESTMLLSSPRKKRKNQFNSR